MRFSATLLAVALLTPAVLAQRGTPPSASSTPARPGVDLTRLARIDAAVAEALTSKKLPGAVVLVGHRDAVVFQKAYGQRASVPAAEPMTLDTVFDLASLTKVVATTTAVMMLVEDGTLRLNDTVASFIPDFARYNKARITLRDLLTHMSGLRPDVDLGPPWTGHDEAIRLAIEEVPTAEPGRRFVYSDINFFLLAEVVAIASRQPFDQFVQTRIFGPLGMRDTMFNPPEAGRPFIAPTQRCTPLGDTCEGPEATMLRGVVHDPTARRMGGVAGHAGLFSTASDLAIFCRMLLNGGVGGGRRVLSPLTVARMIAPASPATEPNVRGLGWDLDSSYSSNRGEFLPLGSFGHTGFTGTSLWLDPATATFVVFLSNRVHPDGTGDVTPLRARVASIAASALTDITLADAQRLAWPRASQLAPATAAPPVQAPLTPVLTGIDVLRAENFASLKGLRVGLLTNHTGLRARWRADDRPAREGPGRDARVALQSRAWHSRHPRRGRSVVEGREDRAADPFALRPDAAAHRRDARGHRRRRHRPAGHRRALLHLHDDDGVCHGGGRAAQDQGDRAGPAESDRRRRRSKAQRSMRPAAGTRATSCRCRFAHGMTMGELAQLFNAENKIGADLTRRRDEGLAARRVVRRDRPLVDQPVAEHAQSLPGDALPRHRRLRGDEHLGGARHRHAVRADRRAVDRRAAARRSD